MAHIRYSCISTIVAPSNLIIIASTGMEVYNGPKNLKEFGHVIHEI